MKNEVSKKGRASGSALGFIKERAGLWIARSYPVDFGVEVTNACNANCSFCAYRFRKRKTGVMTMDIFKKAVDDYCAMGGGDINFTAAVGDALLDRGLLEKIHYARAQPRIRTIWFYTNMIGFHNFSPEKFVLSGINMVRISTCIKDEPTFRKVYGSVQYHQVLDNIEKLCKANLAAGSPIDLCLFLRIPKPIEEAYASADFKWIGGYFSSDSVVPLMDDYDSWNGLVKEEDLPAGNKIYKNDFDTAMGPCAELYRRINVLYDGKVNNCVCRDMEALLTMGDNKTHSLLSVWRGADLKRLRADWAQGKVPALCAECQRYLPAGEYARQRFKDILSKRVKRFLRKLGFMK